MDNNMDNNLLISNNMSNDLLKGNVTSNTFNKALGEAKNEK